MCAIGLEINYIIYSTPLPYGVSLKLSALSLLGAAFANGVVFLLDASARNVDRELSFAASLEHLRLAGYEEIHTAARDTPTASSTLLLGLPGSREYANRLGRGSQGQAGSRNVISTSKGVSSRLSERWGRLCHDD
jgi:hypothetical protein